MTLKIRMPRASFSKLRNDDAKDYEYNLTLCEDKLEMIKQFVSIELSKIEHDGYATRKDYNEPYWRGVRYILHTIQDQLNKR